MFDNHSNIKYIEEKDIADCLTKTNLLITDYSSIIFDMIYRRKPYIIFIPDANDPMIKNIYSERCYNVIIYLFFLFMKSLNLNNIKLFFSFRKQLFYR